MKPRFTSLVAVVGVFILLAANVKAQSQRGDWELTLAGTGTSSKSFDDNAFGVNAGLGYYVLQNGELSLRQTLAYSKIQGSSATVGSTQIAADWYFPVGSSQRFQPFIGVNGGYFYGDVVSDHFEVAPEAGIQYYLSSSTFIYARAEYQIFVGGNTTSSDRQWVYGLGIGFRF
jgi:outer membrane protein W